MKGNEDSLSTDATNLKQIAASSSESQGMLSYEGKLVLAPMVRVGTLPMRLLALEYGADLVWSPELVDKKIIASHRCFNPRLGTWDYLQTSANTGHSSLIFRTHPGERTRLILQLGSADPQLAVKAALKVDADVAGIDLNCGCPKHFSVHAGMGAALLQQPDRLVSILTALVEGLPHLPISAKIRLLPDRQATMELVRRIAGTGVRALTVHCRTPAERPRQPAHYEWLTEIVQLCPFPVIANGDIFSRADIDCIRSKTGVSSFMIARAAQWNVSIFCQNPRFLNANNIKDGTDENIKSPLEVSRAYLNKALEVENPFANTKYTLLQMWLDRPYSDCSWTSCLQQSKSYEDLCRLLQVEYHSHS